jgi:hypothetical protein
MMARVLRWVGHQDVLFLENTLRTCLDGWLIRFDFCLVSCRA